MQPTKIALGTVAYLIITFPLAYVWHLVVFEKTYRSLGYFSREEPIIAFGFGAILMQGILLSVIYPFLCRGTQDKREWIPRKPRRDEVILNTPGSGRFRSPAFPASRFSRTRFPLC